MFGHRHPSFRRLCSCAVVAVLVVLAPAAARAERPLRLGTEFQVNTATLGTQRAYANPVASDGAGNYIVVWHDEQDDTVQAQRLDPNGAPLGGQFRIDTAGGGDPAVASNATGDFVVAWERFNGGALTDIVMRGFNPDGTPKTAETPVNVTTAGQQTHQWVASDSTGNFDIVWTSPQDGSGYGIFGRRFIVPSLAPVSGEIPVNSYTTGDQQFPQIAKAPGGNFVVVWTSAGQDGSGPGVFGQSFFSTFEVNGSEFQVNTFTTGVQSDAAVAVAPDNSFVVVWRSDDQDGSGSGVFGRRFAPDGIPLTAEFPVNDVTPGNQGGAAIAMDADGAFVVTWSDGQNDGDSYGIFARRFDATGAPQGGQFAVNTHTTSSQIRSGIAEGADGSFLIAWDSSGQDGDGAGMFAQRFALPQLLAGKLLKVTNALPDKPQRNHGILVARDAGVVAGAPGTPGDPSLHGATVRFVSDASGQDTGPIALPAVSWSQLGAATFRGWRYKDPTHALGPCTTVVWKSGKLLKVACGGKNAAFPYDLTGVDEGNVGVVFTAGTRGACAEAAASDGKNGSDQKLFLGRNAPAPVECPVP
jgi:hypothetical protein